MSDSENIKVNESALDIVDSWLGGEDTSKPEVVQPRFEKRAMHLGLGAKYVPHKKKEEAPSILKKKLLREKRRKREQNLENRGISSDSDSEEENMSKAKLIKSKFQHTCELKEKSSKLTNQKKKNYKNWRELIHFIITLMQKYIIEKKLGSGTFGSVFLVKGQTNQKVYALKQVRVSKSDIDENGTIHTSRECDINTYLINKSDNKSKNYFVNMKDQFYTERSDSHGTSIWNNMVLEYVGSTLSQYLKHNPSFNKDIIIKQIIQEVAYIHSLQVIHRDIKPSNILVTETPELTLKLCDFGCSKHIIGSLKNHRSTPLVTSRFYRAPELLMGTTQYSLAIDIWSVGCVITEVLLGAPLFIALDSDAEQLISIINILGIPTEDELVQMHVPRTNREYFESLPPISRIPLRSLFPRNTPEKYIHMIETIFQYDPSKRPTACELLSECMS